MTEELKPCPYERLANTLRKNPHALSVKHSKPVTEVAADLIAEQAATISTLTEDVERLKKEADGEFVSAAVRVMRKYPGFDYHDYPEGISADDFEVFFTEDMNEAWRAYEREKARAEAAEAEVDRLETEVLHQTATAERRWAERVKETIRLKEADARVKDLEVESETHRRQAEEQKRQTQLWVDKWGKLFHEADDAQARVKLLEEALRHSNHLLGSIPACKNNRRVADAIHANRAALSSHKEG